MIKYYFLLITSISYFSIHGQSTDRFKMDRLLSEVDFSEASEDQVNLYIKIGTLYKDWNQIDSSELWFNHSILTSEEEGYNALTAKTKLNLGEMNYRPKGDLISSNNYFEQAIELFSQIGDTLSLAKAYFGIGKVVSSQGLYPAAQDYFQKALDIYEIEGDSIAIVRIINSLGIISGRQENFKKAMKYFKLVVNKLSNHVKAEELAIFYNNIGMTYQHIGLYDSSIMALKKGLVIERKNPRLAAKSVLLNNIGSAMRMVGQLDSAIWYHQKSLSMAKEIGSTSQEAWCQLGLGKAYLKRDKLDLSSFYAERALLYGKEKKDRQVVKQSLEILHEVNARSGLYGAAYEAHLEYKAYSDSLSDVDNVRKVAALEFEYERQKSEKVSQLELKNQEVLYEAELDKERWIRYQIFAGLIGVILILIVLSFYYLNKEKANRLLKEKNDIISHQAANLEKINQSKDRFFSIISHDLRGPMSVFIGTSFVLQSLVEERKHSDLIKLADSFGKQAEYINDLLDNLLKWSLQQQGEFPFKLEKIDLKECVDTNIKVLEPLANSKEIDLISSVSDELTIMGDWNSLLTVFRNLISNALKFTMPGGKVIISNTIESENIRLSVQDTGIGMSEEKVKSLFDFSKESSTFGTKGEKGVGLGLQLVWEFVEMNGGKVEVESEEGNGTTFHLVLKKHSTS